MTASKKVAKVIIQKSIGSKWANVESFVDEVADLIERELRLPEVVADLRACYTSPADHNKLFPNFTENADRRIGAINFRAERALATLGEPIVADEPINKA